MIPISLGNEVLGTIEVLDRALEDKRRAEAAVSEAEYDLRGYCLHNESLRFCLKVDLKMLHRAIAAQGRAR